MVGLELRIVQIMDTRGSPESFYAQGYKHTSNIGGEPVEYAFAPTTKLTSWGGHEFGYAESGMVAVSTHLDPQLVPFVALHLLYTTLDPSQLEQRLGLDRGELASIGTAGLEKFKIRVMLGIASQYLDAGMMDDLIDLYKRSTFANHLDLDILTTTIATYNPEGVPSKELITRDEATRSHAVAQSSRYVTSHHLHRQVRRSRGIAALAQRDFRVARYFGSDVTRADKVLTGLDQQYLQDNVIDLCRLAERLAGHESETPLQVDAFASGFLYEALSLIEPTPAPVGAIRKQHKLRGKGPYRFLEEKDLAGHNIPPGHNIIEPLGHWHELWTSLHTRLRYIIDQQHQEIAAALAGSDRMLTQVMAGDTPALDHARRVLALLAPQQTILADTALVPLEQVVDEAQEALEPLREVDETLVNALVCASPASDQRRIAAKAHALLIRLGVDTSAVDPLIRASHQAGYDRLAARIRPQLPAPER